MNNISEHITFREATFSQVAIQQDIINMPGETQLHKMKLLAERVFEPLREGLGNHPIRVTSFFRSQALNQFIGGARSSQHVKGEAIDLDSDSPTNAEIFRYIKDYLEFDQLIWEFGDNEQPSWVHVSYRENNNRKQILRCVNGHYYKFLT